MIDINFISPTGGIVKSVNGKTGRVELTAADVGAATEEYVAQKIAEAELAGGEVDLSAYYTKSETDKAIAKAQPDLSPYAKKTEIPSTKGLASEDYVDDAIANIDFPETDLTDYATKEYVGQKIAEAQLAESDVDLSDYYTKSETDAAIKKAVDEIDIPESADLSNYYNKQEVDAKIPDTSGFATTEYVDDQIAAIPNESITIDDITLVQNEDGVVEVSGTWLEEQVLALIDANLPSGGDYPSGEEVSY